jgi:signal transduction histidine kinase
VILLSFVYSGSLNQEYNRKIDQLSSGIINEKKHFLRNAVERTIFLIETERELVKKMPASQNMTQKQIDEISVERISTRIRDLRLIDNGYVWVNRIVNYQGGDKYAIRQIHPNLPHTEGDWLSTKTTDIQGNKPYEVELNGVKKHGEVYFEYSFKKLTSDKIAHKMSFAKLYKPWDWVVATGVYLDDVDQIVHVETENMKKTLKKQTMYSFSIAAFAVLISTLILMDP